MTIMTQQEAEQQFADATAAEGYGYQVIPTALHDDDWHAFKFPDGHNGSAKLNYGERIEGVVIDRRLGNSPSFVWRPANGVAHFTDTERRARAAEAATLLAAKMAKQAEARLAALQLYFSLTEATPDHPYLVRKNIRNVGPLKAENGDLIVPVFNALTDDFQTYQRIDPDGGKLFPKDGVKKCGYAMPGTIAARTTLNGDGPIIICEGYATADAVRAVTFGCVIAALDCGNIQSVVEAIRKRFPLREIIIAADNDADPAKPGINPGVNAANKAAMGMFGVKVAIPPPGDLWTCGMRLVKLPFSSALTRQPRRCAIRSVMPRCLLHLNQLIQCQTLNRSLMQNRLYTSRLNRRLKLQRLRRHSPITACGQRRSSGLTQQQSRSADGYTSHIISGSSLRLRSALAALASHRW